MNCNSLPCFPTFIRLPVSPQKEVYLQYFRMNHVSITRKYAMPYIFLFQEIPFKLLYMKLLLHSIFFSTTFSLFCLSLINHFYFIILSLKGTVMALTLVLYCSHSKNCDLSDEYGL